MVIRTALDIFFAPVLPMRALYLSSVLARAPAVVSAAEPEAAAGAPAPRLEAPRLIDFVEAPWPEGEARRDAAVTLLLTIDASGAVTEAEVAEPAGAAFDAAAREAALAFRFEPARRGGTPMASRIRYVYEFRLPPPVEEAPAEPAPVDAPADEELVVVVQGESEATRRRNSAEAVVVIETEQAQRQAADMGELLARQEGVSVRRSGGLGSS
jgi:TonB family protein